MADITRWDPFSDISALRRTMDRFFDEPSALRSFFPSGGNGGSMSFPIDVMESGDNVVVEASLPGMKPDDIDISVTGQVLTLKGESRQEHEHKAENYYRHERTHGSFVRQIGLPTEVDTGKAQASFEDGVLCLTLPKAESMKPKTIKVQAKPLIEANGGTASR
ncbi:MAG: Hsp20/alpha crystallin family protein [Dehalococcoidia bacterium]|nr:Hsp20/alpha crystallin family protein [Dehalococcoidia bacterium]